MIPKKVKNSAFYFSASCVSNHRSGKLRKSIVISFLTLSISPCAWSTIYSILRCIRLAHYDLM
jgi:hypothetical protein